MIDESRLCLPHIQDANQAYAADAAARPTLAGPPAKRLCILTCMDARLDLFPALGLSVGDAHYLRNAGGRATADAIRSLVLSAHFLGTREYGVIHHTRCGLHGVTNDTIWDRVQTAAGADAPHIDFLPFADLDASVEEDVQAIVDSKLLPADAVVWGATLDVDEGTLHVVVPPTPLT